MEETVLQPTNLANRIWRVFATGFCFTVFGIGGLVVLCIIFPLLFVLCPFAARRQRIARWLVHHSFRFFVWLMESVGVIRVDVEGREKLKRRGLLVIANHPSLIDVVMIISLLPNANCIVKSAAWRNPFMAGPVRMCGFLRNSDAPTLIASCIASLHDGDNLIIFPEGTRTQEQALRRGEVNELYRGVAQIALRGQFALTPVIITVSEPMLTKQNPWYQIPSSPAHFTLTVLDDVPANQWVQDSAVTAQAARLYTKSLSDFLNGAIKQNERTRR